MKTKLLKRVISTVLTVVLLVTMVLNASLVSSAETLAEMVVSPNEPVKFEYLTGDDYADKLAEYSKLGYTAADIDKRVEVSAKDFTFADTIPEFTSHNKKDNVFLWNSSIENLSVSVEVPSTGLYTFGFNYFAETTASAVITRSMKLDGKLPFEQANSIVLPRMWLADGEPVKNAAGDEVRPLMKQLEVWQSRELYDGEGEVAEPFQVYLTAGVHTFEFEYLSMDAYIASFFLDTYEAAKSYKEVLKEWKEAGYKNATKSITFEAEDSIEYSNQSTYRMDSDGDPLCSPISRGYTVMNIVGASGGKKCGSAITLKFTAKQSGLYKLAFRVRQNYRDGLPSYKKIEIDNEVPFEEFKNYCFYNDDNWRTEVLGDEKGNPYFVYLEKGEHTITITSMLGDYNPINEILYADAQKLSDLLLEIRKITGTDPDYNYDYKLEKQIPYLIDTLNELTANMKVLMNMIEKAAKQDTAKYNEIKNMIEQVEAMKKDVFKLPRKLKDLDTIVSQYSSWILQFAEAPLDIDYIIVAKPDEEIKSKRSNFFQILYSTIVNFILSFTKDYDNISNLGVDANNKTIDVWVSRGTAWGNAIKNLIDGSFTPEHNVNVKMNIVPAGQLNAGSVNTLMLAIASGTAPDVCLGVATASVGEFAMRDVLVDLSKLDGFNELKETTYEENYTPNTYKDKVYGIPETINFATLIYRKDIFSDLGIAIPNTWDDVYNNTIPMLLQNNMEFYLPLNEGWGLYQTFLYQHGGDAYNEDLTASAFDTLEAYNAFVEVTELVTKYGIPTSANFFNRFRSGEMPIGWGDMTLYMQIATAAPEIAGRWGIARVPGRVTEDGSINYTRAGGSETSVVVIDNDDLPLDEAWQFVKWWMSTEIQLEFGYTIEAEMGTASRWNSANKEAFFGMAWDKDDLVVIKDSLSERKALPIVLGGYYTSRYLNTAYNKTAISNENAREQLEVAVDAINAELERRRNKSRK